MMMKKMMSKFSKMGLGSGGGMPDITNMFNEGSMAGMGGMSGFPTMPVGTGNSATKKKQVSKNARKQARKKAKKARKKNR